MAIPPLQSLDYFGLLNHAYATPFVDLPSPRHYRKSLSTIDINNCWNKNRDLITIDLYTCRRCKLKSFLEVKLFENRNLHNYKPIKTKYSTS